MRLAPVVFTTLVLSAALLPDGAAAQSGFGVIAGEPTGVTARFMRGGNNFQAHAAWSFSHDAALQVSGDYLRSGSLNTDTMMPFYFGVGVRLKLSDDASVGVRVPLGVNHYFADHPFEVFAEIVPVVELIPDTGLIFNGGVGLRFYPGGVRP